MANTSERSIYYSDLSHFFQENSGIRYSCRVDIHHFDAYTLKGGMMKNEQKRNNIKGDNNGDRDRASGSWDIDADPLTDFVSYTLSQYKLPRRVRIFIFLYGIYWRLRRLVWK
jgi:hypothetical protein